MARSDPLPSVVPLTTFGEALKYLRKRARLTQRELALATGYSEAHISYLENNQRIPDVETVAARFIPALELHDAPELAAHLVELAAQARGESLDGRRLSVTYTVERVTEEQEPSPEATPAAGDPAGRPMLPALLTPLVGRDAVLAELLHYLAARDVRLLTLTGAPGIGKTSLAIHVAHRAAARFADGVAFVPLEPIRDVTLVPGAIAQALGVPEEGTRSLTATLHDYLQHKRLLLVLDNFEHLTAATPFVSQLLATSGLTIIVTSREALRLRGEQEFPVPPLALTDPAFQLPTSTLQLPTPTPQPLTPNPQLPPAIELFVARAQAVKQNFQLTAENAPAVAEICRRLDGLPLAIELAAARVKLLSPAAILARLDGRLDVLAGGRRDAPAHQRTLRDAIAWSYHLLEAHEQTLFRRLAVLVGGWTLEMAEAIMSEPVRPGSPDVLDALASLVDKSLVRVTEVAGEPRYAMLEVILAYAGEQLVASGEADALRWRCAQAFMTLVEEAGAGLRGPQQQTWANRLSLEQGNLRAVLQWALAEASSPQQRLLGLRLAGGLARYWEKRGYLDEGAQWLERAMAIAPVDAPALDLARVYRGAGTMAWMRAEFARAIELHQAALALYRQAGDLRGIGFSLHNMSVQYELLGEQALAWPLHEQAAAVAQQSGDRWLLALALIGVSLAQYYRGNLDQAVATMEAAVAHGRAANDPELLGLQMANLVEFDMERGDLDRAAARLPEMLTLNLTYGAEHIAAHAHQTAGLLHRRRGALADAVAAYQAGLCLVQRGILRNRTVDLLTGLAITLAQAGQHFPAARLASAAAATRTRIGSTVQLADQAELAEALAGAETALGADAFATAWQAGQALELEAAVAEALQIAGPTAGVPSGASRSWLKPRTPIL